MISETRMARSYSSFWRSAAPTMELFVKRCNLDLYERIFDPIVSSVDPDRRAIVNQFAFEMFSLVYLKGVNFANVANSLADTEILIAAASTLATDADSLSEAEVLEARELARRMWMYFHHPKQTLITVKPAFRGCGLVMSCVGDVLSSPDTIVEMKDGDRPFRSYEFRQLSIYAALSYNQEGVVPSRLQVLNSRRGTAVTIATEDFAQQIAGQAASTYLYGIIRLISESTISQ
jgi:hypothetical protein